MFSCLIFRFKAYTPTTLKPISSTNIPNLMPYMMLIEVKEAAAINLSSVK
jgi:hypothetical protein